MTRRRRKRIRTIIIAALLPVSIALMILPSRWMQPGRDAMTAVTGPVEVTLSRCFRALAEFPRRLRDSRDLIDRNESLTADNTQLRSEVELLRTEVIQRERLIAQLSDLRRVLRPETGYEYLPADIVGKERVTLSGVSRTASLTLGIGSQDGVRRDDLVVQGFAVVGKITSVGPFSCRVTMVTDPDFGVAARVVQTGVEGVVQGGGPQGARLTGVGVRSPVKEGMYVVTSGFENLHPPGLLLGAVTRVAGGGNSRLLNIDVEPALDLDRLDQVIVVRRRTN